MLAELDLGLLAGDTPYPFRVQCEQSKLTPILLRELAGLAEVRFGHRVTGVAARAGGVVVETSRGPVRGGWLIAADGAHSAVRRALGVPFEGVTYPERFLVASTDEDLTELLPGLGPVAYVSDPVEWLVLLRTPDHWRVLLPTPPAPPTPPSSAAWPRACGASPTRDGTGRWPTPRSTGSTSGWPPASGRAACCWPGTPPTSTTRSAAWA
nr:hypothetical protein GCM10020093_008860 [Planobispora longispora]